MARQKMKTVKKQTTTSKSSITFEYAYSIFKITQEEKRNSKATLNYYDRCYKKMVAHFGETETVDILTERGTQQGYITFLGDVNEQTINSYLRGYRAFGNFCEEEGFIEGFKCPIKEVDPPVKQVYTDKELRALTVKPNIENFEEYRNYLAILLILATGARANSLINIRICDVELEEGYITLNTTKAHKIVRIGLERKAERDLTEYINYWRSGQYVKPTDYLICNCYGEQLTRNALAEAIKRYNRKRGVYKTSIHLLRHTFAKNWITSGGDIISLAKVLTHSELEMVKRYSNLYGSDVKKEIEEHSTLSQMRQRSGKTLKTQKRYSSLR